MRKLATIRKISKLLPIEGADKIQLAIIDGWQVVTAISNGFKENDLVLYLEIDSWVPHSLASFLTKPGFPPKEYKGMPGQRLKSIRLRGQLSQGLILPLSDISEYYDIQLLTEGQDLTEGLRIQKWEKEIPAQLRGSINGNFPSYIPKTDQERMQNYISDILNNVNIDLHISLKMDGTSMTVYKYQNTVGVCSRNYDLKDDEQSSYWKISKEIGLVDYLNNVNDFNYAFQGELVGPGIQKNPHKLEKLEYYIYDVWDINNQQYLNPVEMNKLINSMNIGLNQVPIIKSGLRFIDWADNVDAKDKITTELMKIANDTKLEGIVVKQEHSSKNRFSFKVISNNYLLNETD